MKFSSIALVSIALQSANVVAQNLRNKNADCRAYAQDIQFEDGHDEQKFACARSDGAMIDIVGEGADELAKLMKAKKFKSGKTAIRNCQFKGNGKGPPKDCYLPRDIHMEDFSTEDTDQRRLKTGTKTVLVVRVVAPDASTSASEAALSDSVFGTNGDPINLASQYSACSYDQLQFQPASSFNGINFTNGVTTTTITQTVNGVSDSTVRNAVTNQLSADFGGVSASNLADYVMLCLPPGTSGGWIAYAYINWYLSVYNNNWCTYVSGQMHEVGHNLGLAHSGEGSTYDDQSGMMGYSYSSDDGPIMCFNAAKSWQLGWYATKSQDLDVATSQVWDGSISGFVDYENAAVNTVLIKINSSSGTDYYVNFNRKSGFNSGTQEGGDRVLVSSGGEGNSYATSTLIAKLNTGGARTLTIDGKTVTIQVNSIQTTSPGFAHVTITIGNVTPNPPTPNPAPNPTAAPVTPNPTPIPTDAPVNPNPLQHWINCGKGSGCTEGNEKLVDATTKHEVRCCKDDGVAGNDYSFKNGCSVLGASKIFGVCYHAEDFTSASDLCASTGGRLCSRDEVESLCTKGTGCNHDADLVWTCSGDNLPCGSNSDCCSGTCDIDTDTCVPENDEHWIACGKGSGCTEGNEKLVDATTKHEVRCCKDGGVAGNGYSFKNGCSVLGASEISGVCYHAEDFTSASDLCASTGGRLCSRDEVGSLCTKGTGCSHDHDLVWTCSGDNLPCGSNSDCCSGMCHPNTETCVPENEDTANHWIVCGKGSGCPEGIKKLVDATTKHEVRCCKDGGVAGNGYSFKNGCSVLGASKISGVCYHAEDFTSASDLCASTGGRLCSRDEVESLCTKGTGCQHDNDLVWTCSGGNLSCEMNSDCCSGMCNNSVCV